MKYQMEGILVLKARKDVLMKYIRIFLIIAQNIDRGYALEPPLVLTITHDLCFRERTKKIMYTPVDPNFTIYKWCVSGSSLHGNVSMMI